MEHLPVPNPLTKIVATVGPASEHPEILEQLIRAGVSTFRLNFSHGAQQQHEAVYHSIRNVAAKVGSPTTILQDLQGPKLRVGDLDGVTPIPLETGDTISICTTAVLGTADRISTTYEHLARDVRVGDTILIDDGLIELRATDLRFDTDYGDEVIATVVYGGNLKPQKGINLPGTIVSAPSMTAKDIDDLEFGIRLGVDMVALSFVRSAQDVLDAKEKIRSLGGVQPLISKIEKPQAVQAMEAIVDASDGLMVARGDLGVEMSADRVPLIQKRLIQLANAAGKPVITATQMLESMIQNPRATRAEASDIANAILDGTDAVMLSGETAIGAWPVRAVETMARIARTIESDPSWHLAMKTMVTEHIDNTLPTETTAVGHAVANLTHDLHGKAIGVVSATGATAQRVSQRRPGVPILAFADRADVAAGLSLMHGLVPVYESLADTTDELLLQVERGMRRLGHAGSGDRIVVVCSMPRPGNSRAIFIEFHQLT